MESIEEKKIERIVVKLGKGYIVLKSRDIDWIEAERNYLRLHRGDRSFLIRNTLKNFEKRLDPEIFVRVNRSAMINVEKIRKIESDVNYNYFVILNNDVTVSWGRKFRSNLKRFLYN